MQSIGKIYSRWIQNPMKQFEGENLFNKFNLPS